MTEKVRSAIKPLVVLLLFVMLFISCSDDDLNSVDAGIIDNLNFLTEEIISEVEFSNERISRVESANNGEFLLGVFEEESIGKIRASFVSQLVLPTTLDYTSIEPVGDSIITPSIDDVVLYIPYISTVTSIENGLYHYELDSVFGNKIDDLSYEGFTVKVHELATFLNPLDPTDPSRPNTFYSDKVYDVDALLKEEFTLSPSATDTLDVVERTINNVVYATEDATLTNNAPMIAIHLDTTFFSQKILSILPGKGGDAPSELQSQDSFIRYMKGLYLEVTSTDGASIATLPLVNAFVNMYYSNVVSNSVTGEKIDTIQNLMRFNLGNVRASKYESLDEINYPRDTDKIYLQGTVGSQANVKLFGYDENNPDVVSAELDDLRAASNSVDDKPIWIINEANLQFYVDEDFVNSTPSDIVYKLFLYKKTPNYNSVILDYINNINTTLTLQEGNLVEDNGSYYYKFRITDYIEQLLDGSNTGNVDNFGLRLYNPGDYPVSFNDTVVSSINWNPRGVVLFGGNTGDETSENRVKLKINYSYQNR